MSEDGTREDGDYVAFFYWRIAGAIKPRIFGKNKRYYKTTSVIVFPNKL